MEKRTIYDLCTPRPDVLSGVMHESEFAADLAQVLTGSAPPEYRDPDLFFQNTYPTRGIKALLASVLARLQGSGEQTGSLFRLDTQFGGGKTHSLIALAHVAQGCQGVGNIDEFISADLLPTQPIRVAAFDGENADPANGRRLGGIRAFTPWGELAYQLGGDEGYRLVQRSDEEGVAPGSETLRELFGDEPCLILLDELALYLRKASASRRQQAAEQLSAFLTSLFKAVEATPKVALVFTLALGKDGGSADAYASENQQIASFMAEAASISARKAALLDPTEDDETARVLCRRLFSTIDKQTATSVIQAYRDLWQRHADKLPKDLIDQIQERAEQFEQSYPLHPELMQTLTEKTATLDNFQRVRGMLRLLARTVARLWDQRPDDATAIHLHHLDPGYEPVRHEVVVRMEQRNLVPAIKAEVASVTGEPPALGGELDRAHYTGLPPYGSYMGRAIFWHTLAYPHNVSGATSEQLRFALLSPAMDLSFIDDARKRFIAESAYLDDRPNEPLRFLHTPNLTQIIRRQENQIDPAEVRSQINDRIRHLFAGKNLNLVPFASGPHDVPEDNNDGRPFLVLLSQEACAIEPDDIQLPGLVEKIWKHKGGGADLRINRNNLVFLVADSQHMETMRQKMVRRLALEALLSADKMQQLADYQADKVKEEHRRSERDLAVAIQQTFRHLFYPSRNRLEGAQSDIGHTVIDAQQASEKPGNGQNQAVSQLQQINKLRLPNDNPDAPAYVRDRTQLKKGYITTASLRMEFMRDPALPMLVGDDVFIRGIRLGIEQGLYVYQKGELVIGQGDPEGAIAIDEQAQLFTTEYAEEKQIWPRPKKPKQPEAGAGQDEETRKKDPPPGDPGTGPVPGVRDDPKPATAPIEVEDVLKAALIQAFEQAATRGWKGVEAVTIRPFEAQDVLRALVVINSQSNAKKHVELSIDLETKDESVMEIKYDGATEDARPLKDFIDPQLRAAADFNLDGVFTIRFNEPLPAKVESINPLAEKLARVAFGSALVGLQPAEGE